MDFRTRLRRVGDALWYIGVFELFLGPAVSVFVGFSRGRAPRGVALHLALSAALIVAGILLNALGRPKAPPPPRTPDRD